MKPQPRTRTVKIREGSPAFSWNTDDWWPLTRRMFFVALTAGAVGAADAIYKLIQETDFGPVWTGFIVLAAGGIIQTIRTWATKSPAQVVHDGAPSPFDDPVEDPGMGS